MNLQILNVIQQSLNIVLQSQSDNLFFYKSGNSKPMSAKIEQKSAKSKHKSRKSEPKSATSEHKSAKSKVKSAKSKH